MVQRLCCVCKQTRTNNRLLGIASVNFPKSHIRSDQWAEAIGNQEVLLMSPEERHTKRVFLCGSHFSKECFRFFKNKDGCFQKGSYLLKEDAMPTLNLHLREIVIPAPSRRLSETDNPVISNDSLSSPSGESAVTCQGMAEKVDNQSKQSSLESHHVIDHDYCTDAMEHSTKHSVQVGKKTGKLKSNPNSVHGKIGRQRCVVPSCFYHSSGSVSKTIRYHRLPQRTDSAERWISVLGLNREQLPKTPFVCSEHFDNTSYTDPNDRTSRLCYDAVPVYKVPLDCPFDYISVKCEPQETTTEPIAAENADSIEEYGEERSAMAENTDLLKEMDSTVPFDSRKRKRVESRPDLPNFDSLSIANVQVVPVREKGAEPPRTPRQLLKAKDRMLKQLCPLEDTLTQVLSEELHSDVVFLCGRQQVKSHRLVLSAVSPFLSSIFANIPPEEEPALIVVGFRMEDIRNFLTLIYRGTLSICTAEVEKLKQLLKTLGMTLTLTVVPEETNSAFDSDTEEPMQSNRRVGNTGNERKNVLNDKDEDKFVMKALNEELADGEDLLDVLQEDRIVETTNLNSEDIETRELEHKKKRRRSSSDLKTAVQEKGPNCRFCPEKFSNNKLKLQHERGHPEAYYLCELCGVSMFYRLKAHHVRSHRDLVCSECGKVVPDMERHMNLKHRFVCEICGKTLSTEQRLNFHKEVCHSEEKVFPCHNCSLSFKSKEELEEHDRTTTFRHQISCPVCSKTLGKSHYLNIRPHLVSHARTESKTAKDGICTRCNRHFSCREYLQNHLLVHYMPEWKYECSKCFMVWRSHLLLRKHERLCNGEKVTRKTLRRREKCSKVSHTCANCQKVFVSALNAKFHFETVHNTKSACRRCWTLFDTKAERDEHAKVHDKSTKKRPCIICSKKIDNTSMKPHLIAHAKLEVKNLTSPKCPRCVRQFSSMSQLQNHLLTHYQPQRKLECPHCCLAVRSQFELKTHEKACEAVYGKKKRVRVRRVNKSVSQDSDSETEELWQCSECEEQFRTQEDCEAHIELTHP